MAEQNGVNNSGAEQSDGAETAEAEFPESAPAKEKSQVHPNGISVGHGTGPHPWGKW